MRRRTRLDLGQSSSVKEEACLERKRRRWDERNKNRPEENPFLAAIRPDREAFGEPEERGEELRARLDNQEFGNFPGYFNYRNKSSIARDARKEEEGDEKPDGSEKKGKKTEGCENEKQRLEGDQQEQEKELEKEASSESGLETQPLDAGLSDERLKELRKEWFQGKLVLDIGCNRGHMAYSIARLFSPRAVIGIDIDLKMINMANRDLHLHLENALLRHRHDQQLRKATMLGPSGLSCAHEPEEEVQKVDEFPLASYISNGPIALDLLDVPGQLGTQGNPSSCNNGQQLQQSRECKFPNNLAFVEHNYVLANEELVERQTPFFDTIVCLSVTKWVHLNYRDSGLRRFFKRIFRHLKPDGLLVLEAQPFDNYSRRSKLSDRLKSNFYSIQFKPDNFDAFLLSPEVGFRRIIHESLTEHQCSGFKRPLKVFLK